MRTTREFHAEQLAYFMQNFQRSMHVVGGRLPHFSRSYVSMSKDANLANMELIANVGVCMYIHNIILLC